MIFPGTFVIFYYIMMGFLFSYNNCKIIAILGSFSRIFTDFLSQKIPLYMARWNLESELRIACELYFKKGIFL